MLQRTPCCSPSEKAPRCFRVLHQLCTHLGQDVTRQAAALKELHGVAAHQPAVAVCVQQGSQFVSCVQPRASSHVQPSAGAASSKLQNSSMKPPAGNRQAAARNRTRGTPAHRGRPSGTSASTGPVPPACCACRLPRWREAGHGPAPGAGVHPSAARQSQPAAALPWVRRRPPRRPGGRAPRRTPWRAVHRGTTGNVGPLGCLRSAGVGGGEAALAVGGRRRQRRQRCSGAAVAGWQSAPPAIAPAAVWSRAAAGWVEPALSQAGRVVL